MIFTDADSYIINTENFSSNAQIAKIGESFSDLIRENYISYDVIMGLAYHGIAFSSATAFSLFQKYGVTAAYCYDRLTPDSKKRIICGYTPKDGDRLIIIDDMIGSGRTLDMRLEQLYNIANVEIAAVIAIADAKKKRSDGVYGSEYIKNKYNTEIFTIINDRDIRMAINNRIINVKE